jgi:hypothetical protein
MLEITGIKYDESKPDYSLIPPNALECIARVLTFGKNKYHRDNWKKLDDASNRYFAAAQRHLWALRKGETHDAESGIHHAAHAASCIMFMLELEHTDLNNNTTQYLNETNI